jgi:hypothetical protein
MLPDKDVGCHKTGFAKKCRECVIEHNCQLWIKLAGSNPNTGEPMTKWGCAEALMPFLTIENSQQQRQTGAAVESFRNEMLKLNSGPGPLLIG